MTKVRFTPTPIPRPRRQRRCSHLTLYDTEGETLDVIVRDISSRGLSAAAAGTPPPPHAVVRAVLDDGSQLWGLVRWRQGNLFGVEFDTGASAPAG